MRSSFARPLTPRFFSQVIGVKALLNPTVDDMKHYLANGQAAIWPYSTLISHMVGVESALAKSIADIEKSLGIQRIGGGGLDYALVRTGSSRSRGPSGSVGREVELLRTRVSDLERENSQLRRKVEQLEGGVETEARGKSEEAKSEEPPAAVEVVPSHGAKEDEDENDDGGGAWETVTKRGGKRTKP